MADFQRRLVVTSDTSGVKRGAVDIESFASSVKKTTDTVKRGSQEMSSGADRLAAAYARTTAQASGAAGAMAKLATQAERDMNMMAKAVGADLTAFSKDWNRVQAEQVKATEAIQKRTLSETRAAESLRKTYDSVYGNAVRYAAVEEQVARQVENRNLTVEQGNAILAGAGTRFKQMGDGAKAANQNVKLAGHEMTNLARQGHDVITMFAMGASPMPIFSSQAAQVYDAISSGPGGLSGGFQRLAGSVKAGLVSLAGFAATPIGIAVALGTAATAAIYFATKSDTSVKSAEEALKGYKSLVDSLEDSYARAGDAATRYFERAQKEGPNVALAAIQGSQATLKASLQREMESVFAQTQTLADRSIKTFADLTPEVLKGQDAIRGLGVELNSGAITIGEFRDKLSVLRTDPTTLPVIKSIADKILDGSVNAYSLAAALGAVGEAASAASGKVGRLKVPSAQDMVAPFGGAIPMLDRLNPDAMDTIRKGLKDQRGELTGATKDVDDYASKLAEMKTSLADNVAAMNTQIDTFGQSEGAIAAAKFQTDAMAEAQRLATEANKSAIDPTLVDFIKRQATEYGSLTDKLTGLREVEQQRKRDEQEAAQKRERIGQFEDDLLFERSIAGLPEAEQRVRETLHGLDVDYDSFEGQRLAAGIRYNDSLDETQDRMRETGEIAKDVFFNLVESIGNGEDALGSFAKAFSGIGKQLASEGFDKLFGGLFGSGQGSSGGISGLLGSAVGTIRQAANQNTPPADYARYTAPLGKVERSILPALTNTTQKFASNSDDLATNIQLAANTLGTSAKDLATVISYETGGTFSTSIRGGANDNHIGLIQFGPAEQKRYGAAIGQTLSTQMDAVVGYLKDRGFKPGMGLLDLYSTINAGSPGRYSASDAGNGGAPGSVYDKVTTQMAGHMARADSLLGGTTRDLQRSVSTGVRSGFESLMGPSTGYSIGSANDPWSSGGMNLRQAGGGGILGSGMSGMQGLGVAAGAFGAGYEGGNAISGALSGALSGVGGGPAGMAIGAIAGAIGGRLGTRSEMIKSRKVSA